MGQSSMKTTRLFESVSESHFKSWLKVSVKVSYRSVIVPTSSASQGERDDEFEASMNYLASSQMRILAMSRLLCSFRSHSDPAPEGCPALLEST